ncbi:MAG: DUF1987 domain-containing protein [Bacteroidales bacterium]|nr:DUF1987 domain-containing protein [Bacteroidales bacterium]
MDPINIKKTKLSPKVILDKANNIFLITGRSIYANANEFYEPIISWFNNYMKNPNKNSELIFYLDYVNSSSSFQIIKLLDFIYENKSDVCQFKVTWLYGVDDEMSQETGKDIQYSTDINIDLKEFDASEYADIEF